MTYTPTNTPNAQPQAQAQELLPGDINKALSMLINEIDRLHKIYTQETAFLKEANRVAFLDIQEEKYQSAMRYESFVRQIIARKTEMDKADPQLKKSLKEKQNQFDTLAKDNIKTVRRMQKSAQHLGDTLRKAAIKAVKRQSSSGYNQSGSLDNSTHKPVSASINETA